MNSTKMKYTIYKQLTNGKWKYVGIARNANDRDLKLFSLRSAGFNAKAQRFNNKQINKAQ